MPSVLDHIFVRAPLKDEQCSVRSIYSKMPIIPFYIKQGQVKMEWGSSQERRRVREMDQEGLVTCDPSVNELSAT
jgi:hypothetical protein